MSNVTFFSPEYYEKFQCKGGACRRSCCGGWPIAVSMEEYFRLIGMDCSPALRRRMDCAFHFSESGDEACYAKIYPNFIGDCPMHREDGLCALHGECGEDALPDVCRLFPRVVLCFGHPIRLCSSACEHTVELLTESDEPLRFVENSGSDALLKHVRTVEHTPEREAIFRFCLGTMADRSLSLFARIHRIAAHLLGGKSSAAEQSDEEVFAIQRALATHYAEHSASVGELCRQSLDAVTSPEEFCTGLTRLEERFPSLWIWLEKVFSNYMVQECFPFTARERELPHEGEALSILCAFCLYLLVGYQPKDREEWIDCVAAIFRLVGHTAFDHNALVIARRALETRQ